MGLYLNGIDVYVFTDKKTGTIYVGGIRALARATGICEQNFYYWLKQFKDGGYENKKVKIQTGFYIKHGNKKIK